MLVNNLIFVVALAAVSFGCSNEEPSTSNDLRIISLSPSLTSTLVDLGFEDTIVGRSAFCKAVDMQIPVVGDLYEIDFERLLRLAPSHVFVQETASGIDEHLRQLADQGKFVLQSWRIDRLDDIVNLHRDLQQILGKDSKELLVDIQHQGVQLPKSILIMTPGRKGGAGLCFGRETYLDDLLLMMGGENALQRTGWISLSLEDIAKLEPAMIIVISDSFISDSVLSDMSRTFDCSIIPFVHEDVLIPSSRIVDVAMKLQQAVVGQ